MNKGKKINKELISTLDDNPQNLRKSRLVISTVKKV